MSRVVGYRYVELIGLKLACRISDVIRRRLAELGSDAHMQLPRQVASRRASVAPSCDPGQSGGW